MCTRPFVYNREAEVALGSFSENEHNASSRLQLKLKKSSSPENGKIFSKRNPLLMI